MSRRSGHSPAIGTAGGPSSPLSRSRSTSLETEDETLSQPPHSPAAPDYGPSPSASAFLKTAETLEGLANQLSILSDVEHSEGEPAAPECCCTIEASRGRCKVAEDKEKMATKLALSGEIGNALLLRYEALEKKYTFEVKRLEHQLEVKRVALADSVRRAHALDKANGTHLSKYAELNRKYEALEKRYTQSQHTQTLTQQSLTHVRSELTTLRGAMQRQSIAIASGVGTEERLAESEKRYEDARDAQIAAERSGKEEGRKRARAELRIAELEEELRASQRELESNKEARSIDAQMVLDNAKSRLESIHQELSETFRADSPAEQPEYLKAMGDLVASNAMLKHDATELSHLLAESRDEVRTLKEEIERVRSLAGIATAEKRSPNAPSHLAAELRRSYHNRTESSPNVGTFDRSTWARMSVSSSSRWAADHNRRSSFAPSFASTSTTDGLTSPGLGLGSIGEFGGVLTRDSTVLSPPPLSPRNGKDSPKQGMFRTSPGGGIGYVVNGVPKIGAVKQQFRRRASERPRLPSRSFTSQSVDPIAESGAQEADLGFTTDEPISPASASFRAADLSRKRRSLMLQRHHSASPHESTDYSITESQTLVDAPHLDVFATQSDGEMATANPRHPSPAKAAHRKTLLLLTKSKGTQTEDAGIEHARAVPSVDVAPQASPRMVSVGSSPKPEDRSETSSLHHPAAGALSLVVDHLSKLLGRLRAADIPTLNKRLKKHHLSGDVSHLSHSTLRALQTEIGDIKHLSRTLLESTGISRKEWNMLFKLLREVFTELVDMQAVINDVTLEPKLAKRLQKEAFRDEEAEEAALAAAAAGSGVGGLGWIANPITRLFVTPAAELPVDAKLGVRIERGKLQAGAPGKSAPKQVAVSGATTTHVSVEFGGAGIVRRATPAGPTTTGSSNGVADALPPSPNPMIPASEVGRQLSSNATTSAEPDGTGTTKTLRPPAAVGTLRPVKSRANRNELLGIFAGAGQRPIPPLPSGLPPISPTAGPSKLRHTSSQYFPPSKVTGTRRPMDETIKVRQSNQHKRLSAVVDAVTDSHIDALGNVDQAVDDEEEEQPFQPLLTRTLRPRGMSDSSIRSTFVSQAASTTDTAPTVDTGPAARQTGYAGGLFAGIGRRLYWSNKTEVSATIPADNNADGITVANEVKEPVRPPVSPSKPISVSPTLPQKAIEPSDLSGSVPAGTSITNTGGGFLGRLLASSLTGDSMTLVDESDDEGTSNIARLGLSPGRRDGGGMLDRVERQEMRGASLRQGVMLGRSVSRQGARWQ